MVEQNIELDLAKNVVDNFNLLMNKIGCNNLDFDKISDVLDIFIQSISVTKDKTKKSEYERSRKKFNRFIAGDKNIIKNSFKMNDVDIDKFVKLFDEDFNDNWYLMHVIALTYISYIKKINDNTAYNYSGMISKLLQKINEYKNKEKQNSSCQNVNKEQLKTVNKNDATDEIVNDVKNILINTSTNDLGTKGILDCAKNVASKYQSKIMSGEMTIDQLLGSMFKLINDKDKLSEKFKDVKLDEAKMPNPAALVKEVSKEPAIGNLDIGNMLSSFMGENNNIGKSMEGKTIPELEKETDRMMREIDKIDKINKQEKK